MRNVTTITALLVVASFSLPASACLNDRDSDALAAEAKRLPITAPALTREAPDIPGIVEVITGRFPRNPALYYQLRIKRCQKELTANPKLLALYDDISVAYDKLGKSGEALVWIEKKRSHIPAKDTEALYRYFANAGTFRAHRWLREGAKAERIGELKQARNEIAEAVRLKPEAHFGREAMQLLALEWLLEGRNEQSLGSYVQAHGTTASLRDPGHYLAVQMADQDKKLLGLAGLVVLGNAWESVDTFGALAGQLYRRGDGKLGLLAELRAREVLAAGKHSLWTAAPEPPTLSANRVAGRWELIYPGMRGMGVTNQNLVVEKYKELRTSADSWQAARTAFMEARLKADRHPDTDSHFWDGYKEPPVPSLDIPWYKEAGDNFNNSLIRGIYFAPLLLLLGIPSLIGLIKLAKFLMRRAH